MLPVRNMSPGFVRNAVNASILMIVVNALIQKSTANSGPSASSGRCRETEGKKKSIGRWGDGVMRDDKEARKPGNREMRRLGYKE